MKASFIWSPIARAELRRVERETAMRILRALARYGDTGEGDVKSLEGRLSGTYRLRVGPWRIRFRRTPDGAIHVLAVENRGQAY